jgi:ABC-2 type transport system permease protein
VGLTALIRSAEGSSAVVNALYLPLSFISGAFFSEDTFPQVLQTLAAILPLSHLIQLARDVMVSGDTVWDHLGHVAVIVGWGLVGLVVSVRGFRWEPRER